MEKQPKQQTRRARGRHDDIRSSAPSGQSVQRLNLPALTRIAPDYIDPTLGNKSGFATFNLEIGDATYRAVTWGIKCTEAIVDVTVNKAGIHYVKTELLSDYLGEVRLVANGSNMQSLDQSELYRRNSYQGIDFGPVFTGFAFPGEHTYTDQRMTNAYALGTLNFRSLSLELKIRTGNFDDAKMEVVVMPHVVDRPKPAGFVTTTERLNTTFTGAAKHTYYDLPIDDDLKSIWIQGEGIQHIEMIVDGDKLYSMDWAQYEAYLIEKGRDTNILDGEWFIDLHAEREPRSLAALNRKNERRRDARIKLTLTTTLDSTPVEFLLETADTYEKVR